MDIWQFFSHMFEIAKTSKSFQPLFIVKSLFMSSSPLILHAALNDQSWDIQLNETIRNEENRRHWLFFKVKHIHENPVASLGYTLVNNSIIYVTTQRKHPKYKEWIIDNIWEKTVILLVTTNPGGTLAPAITLLI